MSALAFPVTSERHSHLPVLGLWLDPSRAQDRAPSSSFFVATLHSDHIAAIAR